MAYLSTFHVPADYRDQILALYTQAQASRSDEAAQRRQIETRLKRIKELYSWGDLDAESYRRGRDQLLAELASRRGAEEQQAVLERTAAFLADLPSAWAAPNHEQRNRLARLLFEAVEIKDERVVAITPRPEFAPFFVLDWCERQEGRQVRKRRDSNPRSRP